MIKIENASPEDISVIRRIAEETWWPTYSPILANEQIRYMLDAIYSPEALQKVIGDGSQSFILLHDERGPQGFASFGLRTNALHICKLHKLYVLPQNQGKGFGKVLIEEIKSRLAVRGISILDLNVNRYNPARSFYEKIGFSVIGEEDVPIGPYMMNDYVMRLMF